MSIFSKVEVVAENVLHSANGILVKIFGQTAMTQFEDSIKVIFQDDVIVIFQDAIVAAESLEDGGAPASGALKQSAAFAQIAKDLETKGISLAKNVINLGIEMVVGLLRAKTPAAPAAPSAPVVPIGPATPATPQS
jgi:hypothetical protein